MVRNFSFWVLLATIGVILVLFYRVMINFLVPVFLASILVVIFRPLHQRILKKCKQRKRVAAGLTTAAVMLIVLLPASLIFTLATVEGVGVLAKMDVANMKDRLAKVRMSLGLEMPLAGRLRGIEMRLVGMSKSDYRPATDRLHEVDVDALVAQIDSLEESLSGEERAAAPTGELRASLAALKEQPATTLEFKSAVTASLAEFRRLKTSLLGGSRQAWLKEIANPTDEQLNLINQRISSFAQSHMLSFTSMAGGFVAKLVFGVVIMCVSVYFFFSDGPAMMQTMMRLSPLDDRYEQELLDEFVRVSRAVVMATLLSAIVQGLLAGLGFWIAGLDSVFLLILLTTVFAMIPFIGAAAIWVPACLWLYFFEDRSLAAVMLALYGVCIISMADNVVKPFVLHGQSNLHPLLALLSVLGGVQALGPIGILVGPMVVVFLQTLLNILHRELTSADEETQTPAADSG